jgi:hypothetical protein
MRTRVGCLILRRTSTLPSAPRGDTTIALDPGDNPYFSRGVDGSDNGAGAERPDVLGVQLRRCRVDAGDDIAERPDSGRWRGLMAEGPTRAPRVGLGRTWPGTPFPKPCVGGSIPPGGTAGGATRCRRRSHLARFENSDLGSATGLGRNDASEAPPHSFVWSGQRRGRRAVIARRPPSPLVRVFRSWARSGPPSESPGVNPSGRVAE